MNVEGRNKSGDDGWPVEGDDDDEPLRDDASSSEESSAQSDASNSEDDNSSVHDDEQNIGDDDRRFNKDDAQNYGDDDHRFSKDDNVGGSRHSSSRRGRSSMHSRDDSSSSDSGSDYDDKQDEESDDDDDDEERVASNNDDDRRHVRSDDDTSYTSSDEEMAAKKGKFRGRGKFVKEEDETERDETESFDDEEKSMKSRRSRQQQRQEGGSDEDKTESFEDKTEHFEDEEDKEERGKGDGEDGEPELTLSQQMLRQKYLNDPRRRIRALADQKYHLPNNNWKEDWLQYFANNHPVFGICFSYPEHPIGWPMRMMCFICSVVVGLLITNAFWLWARQTDRNSTLFTVETGHRPGSNLTSYVVDVNDDNNVQVTKDIALLWTVGGMVHGMFDNLVWTLSICACCDAGGRFEHLAKYRRFGIGLLSFFVVIVMAVATLSVVVRGVVESGEADDETNEELQELNGAGVFDDEIDLSQSSKENYEFLMSFLVEEALAMLVYFPLTGTILFSGILGCGRFTQCGGRPYELEEEERELHDLIFNPEADMKLAWEISPDDEDDDDEDDLPEIWGMKSRKKPGDETEEGFKLPDWCFGRGKSDGDVEEGKSRFELPAWCCALCRNRKKVDSQKDTETENAPKRGGSEGLLPSRSRDVSDIDWSSYPTMHNSRPKEEAPVRPTGMKPTKDASELNWSSYPSISRKNKKEDVGSGNKEYTPKPAKKASGFNWNSYPSIPGRKNKKEDVGSNKKEEARSKKSKEDARSSTKSYTPKPTKKADDVNWNAYPTVSRKNKKEQAGNQSYTPKPAKDTSDVNWNAYPSIQRKNKKEKVSSSSSTPSSAAAPSSKRNDRSRKSSSRDSTSTSRSKSKSRRDSSRSSSNPPRRSSGKSRRKSSGRY